MDEGDPLPQCRICLEGGEGLVSPCGCNGTARYVHEACLSRYRRMFRRMDVRRVRCSVCKVDYTVDVVGFSNEEAFAAFDQIEVPIFVDSTDDEGGSSPAVYAFAHAVLLIVNGVWAGFALVQPQAIECYQHSPCFYSWIFFSLHCVHALLYACWYRSWTAVLLGVPAGLFWLPHPIPLAFFNFAFNGFQILSCLILHRNRRDADALYAV